MITSFLVYSFRKKTKVQWVGMDFRNCFDCTYNTGWEYKKRFSSRYIQCKSMKSNTCACLNKINCSVATLQITHIHLLIFMLSWPLKPACCKAKQGSL